MEKKQIKTAMVYSRIEIVAPNQNCDLCMCYSVVRYDAHAAHD